MKSQGGRDSFQMTDRWEGCPKPVYLHYTVQCKGHRGDTKIWTQDLASMAHPSSLQTFDHLFLSLPNSSLILMREQL